MGRRPRKPREPVACASEPGFTEQGGYPQEASYFGPVGGQHYWPGATGPSAVSPFAGFPQGALPASANGSMLPPGGQHCWPGATGPLAASAFAGFPQGPVPAGASGNLPAPQLTLPLAPRPLPDLLPDGQPAPRLWAISPLGLPRTPPALPSLPPLLPPSSEPEHVVENEAEPCRTAAFRKPHAGGGVGPEDWTPVEVQEKQVDRRKFFHNEGKDHTFRATEASLRASHGCSEQVELGQRMELQVDEIHFGNPRVRIMQGAPAPMPQMLKWAPEEFAKYELECAQISFGGYMVWCATGVQANRLLYAMKRCKVDTARVVVVEPPPLPEASEEIDVTYGVSIQGIQLVP